MISVSRPAAGGRLLKRAKQVGGNPWTPIILTLALGLPQLRFPIGIDAANFSNVAEAIINSGVPYRDVWSHAFPLDPVLYAALGNMLGLSTFLPHLIHLLESLAGVALIYKGGQLILSRRHGLLAAYIFGLSSMLFIEFDEVAEPEFIAGLAGTAVTILFMLSLSRAGTSSARHGMLIIGAGLLSGIAVAAKPNTLPLVVVGVFWIWRNVRPSMPQYLPAYVLGALAVPLLLFTWLARAGALSDLIEQVVTFNSYYSSDQGPFGIAMASAIALGFQLGPVLPLAALGALRMHWDLGPKKLWLLFWTGVGVAAVLSQGKHFHYHWLFAFPALSLLAAHALVSVEKSMGSRRLRQSAGALAVSVAALLASRQTLVENLNGEALAVLATLPSGTEETLLGQFNYMGTNMEDEKRVAIYLDSHTLSSDRIFSWARPEIYVMASRAPASKHAYILPLVYGPQSLQAKARSELMSDLQSQMPAYIILPAGSGWEWQMAPGVVFPIDPFPALMTFISSNYVQEVQFGDNTVYRRK